MFEVAQVFERPTLSVPFCPSPHRLAAPVALLRSVLHARSSPFDPSPYRLLLPLKLDDSHPLLLPSVAKLLRRVPPEDSFHPASFSLFPSVCESSSSYNICLSCSRHRQLMHNETRKRPGPYGNLILQWPSMSSQARSREGDWKNRRKKIYHIHEYLCCK